MAQWGSTDVASNSVTWGAASVQSGAGKSAQASNNTALFANLTPGAFPSHLTAVVGQVGVSVAEMANGSGEGSKATAPGWNIRRAWSGPVLTLTAVNGANFGNNSTVLLSNGSVNAVANLTTNATGNLVSAVVVSNGGGVFVNSAVVAFTFAREKKLNNITVTGGSGYSNTDVIQAGNGTINGTATISTNSIGGFANGGITLTNVGLWATAKANVDVSFTVANSTGGASVGTSAVLVANIVASTGGTVAVGSMGGRAGRVHYECLVEHSGISNGAGDDTILPQ